MSTPIRAVISDLDGVVWRGEEPIPAALAALRGWVARGVPLSFVTNNSARSATDFARVLAAHGIPVGADRVITPIEAITALLRDRFAGARAYVIGGPALAEAVEAAGARVVHDAGADLVVVGTDYGLTYDKLRDATNALLRGACLIATNPDRLSPTEQGFEPCVGAIVALFKAAVPGIEPIIMGKPEPGMLHEAMRRMGSDPAETVMVGDQIATDIRAAAAAGVRGFLITTGLPRIPAPDDPAHTVIAALDEIQPA